MGRIFDDRGNRMTPSHARKRGIKYRYYISSALLQGRAEQAGTVSRVPADEIEALVVKICSGSPQRIRPRSTDAVLIHNSCRPGRGPGGPAGHRTRQCKRCRSQAEAKRRNVIEVPWRKTPSTRRREILVPESRAASKTPARSVPRTARSWSHRLRGGAAGSMNSLPIQLQTPKASPEREGCSVAEGQHDDLARLPRARSRQGSHRRTAPARHGSCPPLRPARRMVSPAPDAWPSCAVAFTFEPSGSRTQCAEAKPNRGRSSDRRNPSRSAVGEKVRMKN